jgi:hypothetical protein
MVFVDPQNLGYEPYYFRWVREQTFVAPEGRAAVDSNEEKEAREADMLTQLFKKYFPAVIDYCLMGLDNGEIDEEGPLEMVIPLTAMGGCPSLCPLRRRLTWRARPTDMMKQFCSLFTALVPPASQRVKARACVPALARSTQSPARAEARGGVQGRRASRGRHGIHPGGLSRRARRYCCAKSPALQDLEAVECLYVFCLIWSVGGNLKAKGRRRFDTFVKAQSGRASVQVAFLSFPAPRCPSRSQALTCRPARRAPASTTFPAARSTTSSSTCPSSAGWSGTRRSAPTCRRVPSSSPRHGCRARVPLAPFGKHTQRRVAGHCAYDRHRAVYVPAVVHGAPARADRRADGTSLVLTPTAQIACKKPVLFIGESGTAKTVTIRSFLDRPDNPWATLTINFSSRTNSMQVQRIIEVRVLALLACQLGQAAPGLAG